MAGTYYEGVEPPARLGEMVIEFANTHPHATRAEWAAFAMGHSEECYRSGYVRGRESAERDYEVPSVSPEEVADELDPDWRWSPGIVLGGDPDATVMEVNDDDALAEAEVVAYQQSVIDYRRRE